MDDRAQIVKHLEKWRNDLLDGSKSNPLLYFQTDASMRRRNGVRLFAEIDRIYAALTAKNAQPMPLTPDILLGGVQSPFIEMIETERQEYDAALRRIKRLRERAREAQVNRGINILYVVLGLLEWREVATNDEILQSPLVLVPVELASQGSWSDDYRLTRLADSMIKLNPTLREKLKRDFGVTLPEITEDGALASASETDKRDIHAMLAKVQASFSDNRDAAEWKIIPEAHLGLFTFQKEALYADLQLHADLAEANPIIRAICGVGKPPAPTGPIVPAERLDSDIHPRDMWQVLDADASQQEAIMAAKRKQSFVLQGPPGTGKSQTIANIIAECMAAGKRILFVSEKMAAIEVVQKRLSDVGLGPFCLNLHGRSNDAGEKNRAYDTLKATLLQTGESYSGSVLRWEERSARLDRTRTTLNLYVHELHEERSALEWSAFEVYGKLAKYHDLPDINCDVPDPMTMTDTQYASCRDQVQKLASLIDVLAQRATHPWRQTVLQDCSPAIQANIRAMFDRLDHHLESLENEGQALSQHVLSDLCDVTETELEHWLDLASFAFTTPYPQAHWLQADKNPALRELARSAAEHAARLVLQEDAFLPIYHEAALKLELAVCQEALESNLQRVQAAMRVPLDTLLQEESDWRALLHHAHTTLTELQVASLEMATILGVAPPVRLSECGALIELAAHIMQTPRPLAAWLEPATLAQTRKHVREVRKRYQKCDQNRTLLAKTYDDALFTLDLEGLQERLTSAHNTVLRWMKPEWYRDRSQIKAHVLAEHPFPNLSKLTRDIAMAWQTSQTEQELHELAEEHSEDFGAHFVGAATDWDALQRDLDWTKRLHELVEPWQSLTEAMKKYINQAEYQLADLRAAHTRLAEIWRLWLPLSGLITERLNIGALTEQSGATINAIQPTKLQSGLVQWQIPLDRLWEISQTLNTQRRAGTLTTWEDVKTDLTRARIIVTERAWLADQNDALKIAFAARFIGSATEWDQIQTDLAWCAEALQRHQGVTPPAPFIQLVVEKDLGSLAVVRDLHARLREHLTQARALWRECDAYLPHEVLGEEQRTFSDSRYTYLLQRVRQQRDVIPLLDRWVALIETQTQCSALGLSEYMEQVTRLVDMRQIGSSKAEDFWPIFEKRFCQHWLSRVTDSVPVLKSFRGEEHARLIAEFRQADSEYLDLSRQRLAHHLHYQRKLLLTGEDATDPRYRAIKELRYQVNLKRRKPLRKLIELVGATLSDMMPCWMMSPLTVSEYVNPRVIKFDVVIFDEASQVCAEDAISSILRGRQLIVVGDEKQLPPSNTFRKGLVIDDEDEETEEGQDIQRAESILKECIGADLKNRMLLFHYRSQHEALIAFSNKHFYGGQLTTFPSSQAEHRDGLRFDYLPDGVYGRGTTRTNPREAEHVADLVINHVRTTPNLTLGVVAFSSAQQDAIRDMLKKRIASQPELADRLNEDASDGFFVRNLESVQGDERDVIILSVGYGKDKSGKLTQAFGPLNSEGGERRLNVAITRARKKMILVSSIKSSDITGKSAGARALSGYLDFAERGKVALETSVPGEDLPITFESPFEEAVYDALFMRGLQIDTQVGCSGYRIDLAVRDPQHNGRYVLGIECDGATYHSAKTARDRDRLRQEVLEHLGWKIHRIWSRDWFRDPETEIRKVLDQLGALVKV